MGRTSATELLYCCQLIFVTFGGAFLAACYAVEASSYYDLSYQCFHLLAHGDDLLMFSDSGSCHFSHYHTAGVDWFGWRYGLGSPMSSMIRND